jgi:hypothetical protein
VWTKTTIFIPSEGDVQIPVGGMVIFSGSKAHAGIIGTSCTSRYVSYYQLGSAYSIGNRRLHIYFFSTKTWTNQTEPVESLAEYNRYIQELKSEIDAHQRAKLEDMLLLKLQVYDFSDDEDDIFDAETDVSDGI